MRNLRSIPLALATLALAVPAQAANTSITVQTHNQNGICFLYFPLGEMELAISVKASDNNINVGVDDIPGDLAEAGLDKNVPITLLLGNGKTIVTDDGAYNAGFQYSVAGYWTDKAKGAPLLSYLKGGTEITAKFDGQSFGPFKIQQSSANIKDYAYNWLKSCIADNGGKANF